MEMVSLVDLTAPSAPQVKVVPEVGVVVSWFGASDNTGIAGYEIRDNGIKVRVAGRLTRKVTIRPLSDGDHHFTVRAFDAAGNVSKDSVPIKVVVEKSSTEGNIVLPPYAFNKLVFEDNFDFLDASKWSLYTGPGHAGNGIRDPASWSIQSGVAGASGKCLVCTAQWDHAIQKIRSGGASMRNMDVMYGAFEARVRFEADPLHVTDAMFMTWPQGPDPGGSRVNGENNIWESNSGDRSPMMTFIHYDVTNRQHAFGHPGSDGTKWNIVRMEWTPDFIKIYLNGVLSWTLTDKAAIPDHPHHVTLQLDARRNADPGGPIRAFYDYVRVYQ